jgi:hypothetical protein
MKIVLGLAFKARVGKDTFVNFLRELQYDLGIEVTRFAFADALKDEVFDFVLKPNNISRQHLDNHATKEFFRPLLQWWGAEFRRELNIDDYQGNQNYWVNKVKNSIINLPTSDKINIICISDVRFLSECEMIKELGGHMIKINRFTNHESTHSSENSLENYDGWDYTIENEGTLEEYKDKIKNLMNYVLQEQIKQTKI